MLAITDPIYVLRHIQSQREQIRHIPAAVPGELVRLLGDGASIGLFESGRPGLRIGSGNAELVTLPGPEALVDAVTSVPTII